MTAAMFPDGRQSYKGSDQDAKGPPESDTPETDAICSAGFVSPLAALARSLERRLSLAQTEIKGHMRVVDELKVKLNEADGDYFEVKQQLAQAQSRIAELEKLLRDLLAANPRYDAPAELSAAIDAAFKSRA